MGQYLKYFGILLLVLVLAAWVYLQSHQPMLRGKLNVPILTSEVEVYFDDYGIPHIYGQNLEDTYRAFGYIHAQDRLFQMELMRRVGQGRLAELFGRDMLDADLFFRTVGINRQAREDAAKFDQLPEKARKLTRAYLEGINHFQESGKLPLEFKILQIKPEPYTIEDLYAISGYMAYSFAFALRTDPIVQEIQTKLGEKYLKDLDLAIVNDTLEKDTISYPDSSFSAVNFSPYLPQPHLPDHIPVPSLSGSNNWVLGPSRTLSSKVMFGNDTHIEYASPSVWYEAHLEYPGFSFYGNYLAGIPVPLIGHSRNHAWGLTMFEDDDSDFFIEKFANADSSYTVYLDSLVAPVSVYKEKVKIDDWKDTTITVYETVHGVIINDFLPIEMAEPVSMYWNYTNVDNDLLGAFYRMTYASDMNDFRKAVSSIGSPGLNIAYGDASGNIALWSASKLIKRPPGVGGKRFARGYSSEDQYLGFYPFSDNPQMENPVSGLVFSANQMHDSTTGVLYPGYYAPPTRFQRIEEVLQRTFPATMDSLMGLSLDVVSKTEKAVSSEVASVLSRPALALTDLRQNAVEVLVNWNGDHQVSDIGPTIHYKLLYYILENAMMDELGEEHFKALLKTHLIKRSYPKFLFDEQSVWWDNTFTSDKVETREEIIFKSFERTIDELSAQLGTNVMEWKWGRVHFVEHPHPFSRVSVLKPLFHVGPFSSPGGIETVNNAGFTLNGEGIYTATYGPAMRILIDFQDIENSFSILPTGNSGNVMSPHYADQAEMYIIGEFRKMMMNEEEIQSQANKVLFFP